MFNTMINLVGNIFAVLFQLAVIFLAAVYCLRKWFQHKKLSQQGPKGLSVAFFHPYCNDGGGGERVLWTAVRHLQNKDPNIHCIIYTGGDNVTKKDILEKVTNRFNIILRRDVEFIFLERRFLVEAKMYPYFTLLFQSIGSVFLGLEALFKFVPDIYFDSMGYAFTFPVFKYLGSCRVGCYIHYPTISTDMLNAISDRKVAVNNARLISRNKYLSYAKLIYYKIFAFSYGLVGRTADSVMVNSTWTKQHIVSLWKNTSNIHLVYPPCDVSEFQAIPIPDSSKNQRILSIAQFRPEKDHKLQIRAFHKYLTKQENSSICKLILVGSCRSTEDKERVEGLEKLALDLDISENIEFKVNMSFKELLKEMGNAGIALHSMWNEHFGISVVECMAAGQIIIAHNSGGPKLDIVVEYEGQPTGFLADSVDTYADALEHIFKLQEKEQLKLRGNARKSAERFSVLKFEQSFYSAFKIL